VNRDCGAVLAPAAYRSTLPWAEVRRNEHKGEKNDRYMAQALDFPAQTQSKMRKK
jgi:hypothetical protein